MALGPVGVAAAITVTAFVAYQGYKTITSQPPSFDGPLTYPGTPPPSFGPLINVPAPPSTTSTATPDAPPSQSPLVHEPSPPVEPSPIATTSEGFTDLPHDRHPTNHSPDTINNETGEYTRVDPGTHYDKRTKTMTGLKNGYHTHTWGTPTTSEKASAEERAKQAAQGYGNSTGARDSTPEEIENYQRRYENGDGGQTSPES